MTGPHGGQKPRMPPAPPSGQGCICCRNHGCLPAATLDGAPVDNPALVDAATALQCCEPCVEALFLSGTHPHAINPLLRAYVARK